MMGLRILTFFGIGGIGAVLTALGIHELVPLMVRFGFDGIPLLFWPAVAGVGCCFFTMKVICWIDERIVKGNRCRGSSG
jgi:hypothetical protein